MTEAKQGHTYLYANKRVLALESGGRVVVAELCKSEMWIGKKHHVDADMLEPMPMVYFHGDIPK
jgi:hypothetical protein